MDKDEERFYFILFLVAIAMIGMLVTANALTTT